MKPVRLAMQAFGSYGKRTEIDFEKTNQNLFLITGDTGAGKTTIFDAIVFALYGEASSGANKKDGTELQSQFVDFGVEPFVELIFSEGTGEKREEYRVRRVPRHIRPRKRGTGTKEESESVSLIMPDGSEYSPKETDQKLMEIVGLTKDQFMQVAMIAQGEFVELLRAKTNEKKEIFRKLFHTELYERIEVELDRRKKEKQREMEVIRTRFQTEISHVRVPAQGEKNWSELNFDGMEEKENNIRNQELREQREQLLHAEYLSVTELERFLEQLQDFCKQLERMTSAAGERYRTANEIFLQERDSYQRAKALLERFAEMDRAKNELKECEAEKEKIEEMLLLADKIDAAYEIQFIWQRYQDAGKAVSDMETELTRLQQKHPQLKKSWEEATMQEKEEAEKLDQKKQAFAEISIRVQNALDLLVKIEEAVLDRENKISDLHDAEEKSKDASRKLDELEREEAVQRRQAEELNQTEVYLEQWNMKCHRLLEMEEMMISLKNRQKETAFQEKRARDAENIFAKVSQSYESKHAEYESLRRIFLNTQAGLLAREQLRPGVPCPVCGSIEHPHPCELEEEHKDLTRDVLEQMNEEVNSLRREQEQAAGQSHDAVTLWKEKERQKREEICNLRRKMQEFFPDDEDSEPFSLEMAEKQLLIWKAFLEDEGYRLKQEEKKLRMIRDFLQGVEEKKKKLRQAFEKAATAEARVKELLAASQAALESLEAVREYQTRDEAETVYHIAEQEKENQQEIYQTVHSVQQNAKSAMEHAETLISRYSRELPSGKKEQANRKKEYENCMEEKHLTEIEWKTLTGKYHRKQSQKLRQIAETHNQKKAAAQSVYHAAKEAVGDRTRPVLLEQEQAVIKAEEKKNMLQALLEEVNGFYVANCDAERTLKPMMEARGKIMEEYSQMEHLYNLLAGKVTGARMDIETFVQRYYLKRILWAANRRFQEMSAGQFSLHMCEMDRAGSGKNRGLDLMVYSAVTGKEREVRTLSGGESFMAALSLALGMADQIQESTAAVNLEMMFIDEGFGSLDDHSRNKAVRVLKDMAGGSKMIGIISHVTELKQEIESQLIVSKDEEGSHVRWRIC